MGVSPNGFVSRRVASITDVFSSSKFLWKIPSIRARRQRLGPLDRGKVTRQIAVAPVSYLLWAEDRRDSRMGAITRLRYAQVVCFHYHVQLPSKILLLAIVNLYAKCRSSPVNS